MCSKLVLQNWSHILRWVRKWPVTGDHCVELCIMLTAHANSV